MRLVQQTLWKPLEVAYMRSQYGLRFLLFSLFQFICILSLLHSLVVQERGSVFELLDHHKVQRVEHEREQRTLRMLKVSGSQFQEGDGMILIISSISNCYIINIII